MPARVYSLPQWAQAPLIAFGRMKNSGFYFKVLALLPANIGQVVGVNVLRIRLVVHDMGSPWGGGQCAQICSQTPPAVNGFLEPALDNTKKPAILEGLRAYLYRRISLDFEMVGERAAEPILKQTKKIYSLKINEEMGTGRSQGQSTLPNFRTLFVCSKKRWGIQGREQRKRCRYFHKTGIKPNKKALSSKETSARYFWYAR